MVEPAASVAPPPVTRDLLRLAWPIVVSRSTQVVVGLCDALMVAHLGETALAAATTGALNAFSVQILPMGICFIVASFASQLAGRGEPASARRYGWYGLAIAAVTQVVAMAGIAAVPAALGLLDYEPGLHDTMAGYLQVRLLGCGAAIGIEALANYYGGLGNPVLPMRASVLAMALNVALNWLLIDGHLGAPALGVRGAAAASAIASWVAFAALFAVFALVGRRTRPAAGPLRWREFGRMLRFGVPTGFNWFFEFFAFVWFINVVVGSLGTAPLAAFGAVMQLNSVAFMPAFALASAGAILVGQQIGAGRRDRVAGVLARTAGCAATWQAAVSVAYLVVPALLVAPFVGADESGAVVMAYGVHMLRLSAAWQVFDASAMTLAEALRAAGDTSFTLWARLVIAWAVFVPGSWYTVRVLGGGDIAAMVWIVAYLVLLAGVLLWRFRGGAWQRIELVEPAAA